MESNTSTNDSTGSNTAKVESSLNFNIIVGFLIGVVGLFANGIVLCLLCFKTKKQENTCNALIINQLVLDFFACANLVTFASVDRIGVFLTGISGEFYCKLFGSNALIGACVNGSITGLVVITVERYMKIVHALLYRNKYRPWMQYVALVFPWIYAILTTFPFLISTARISNGKCLPVSSWPAQWLEPAYGSFNLIVKFLLPLTVFIVCYSKIFITIKEQSKIHASNSTNVENRQMTKPELNILKALVYAVAFFVIFNTLYFIYNCIAYIDPSCCTVGNPVSKFAACFSYVNMIVNPFIYASKSEALRSVFQTLKSKLGMNVVNENSATNGVVTLETSQR